MKLEKPRLHQAGYKIVKLTQQQFGEYKNLWLMRKGKLTKTALLLKTISDNPMLKTDQLRSLVNCAYVPDLASSINKKLMSKGLMVVCISPRQGRNEDFHFWCLIEAPIMELPVQMSVNDPLM